MNTDYNLYKIFLYLFEEKSISKTASKLYVSQPAISYSLKELENQLGYTLFNRNSKGIEPTIEAKELYGYISTAFNILNDAENHIKNLNNLNIGTIKIGTSSDVGIFYLSKKIEEFNKKYPGIKFEIINKSSTEMIDMLETRKLDLIIDYNTIINKKNISKTTISSINPCFVSNNNILKNSINSLEELSNYKLILPTNTSIIKTKLDEYLNKKNINLNSVFESNDTLIILNMVKEGLGIGFVPENIINYLDKENYKTIKFSDTPNIDINCIYIEDYLTIATSKFIETIQEKG